MSISVVNNPIFYRSDAILDKTPYDKERDTRFYVIDPENVLQNVVFTSCHLFHVKKVAKNESDDFLRILKCNDLVPKKYLLTECSYCGEHLFHKRTEEIDEGDLSGFMRFFFECACPDGKNTYSKHYKVVEVTEKKDEVHNIF